MTVISSLRNHPYGNAIRTTFTASDNLNTDSSAMISGEQHTSTVSNHHTNHTTTSATHLAELTSKNNKTLTKNSLTSPPTSTLVAPVTATKSTNLNLNRNSSSNAILAQLKSISPNFKSIFVRPKHSKHIDSATLLNKTKLHSRNLAILGESTAPGSSYYAQSSSASSMSSILNSLYYSSANGSSVATTTSPYSSVQMRHNMGKHGGVVKNQHFLTDESTSRLISILPHTEPKELRLNASVDDVLKKFSNESKKLNAPPL